MMSLSPIASGLLFGVVTCLLLFCGAAALFFHRAYRAARKQALSAQSRLNALRQSNAVGFCFYDPQTDIFFAPNPLIVEWLGLDPHDATGLTDLCSPDTPAGASMDAETLRSQLRQALHHGPQTLDWPIGENNLPKRYLQLALQAATVDDQPVVMISATDVTAGKTAAAKGEAFEQIVESVGEGIAAFDMEGRVVYVNPVWADMHGHLPQDLIGCQMGRFYSEASFKQAVEPFKEIVVRKGRHSGKFEHLRSDGTPFPAHSTATLKKDSDGRPEGIIFLTSDISEHKKVEDALRSSEIKFRHLFSLSPEPITVSDLTGRIYEVNEEFCRLTGYSRGQVIGKTALDLGFAPEKWQQIITALTTEGELADFEIAFKAQNQQKHHLLMFAKLIEIKDEFYILSVMHDITEQRRLEDRLRESQKLEAIGTLAGGIAHDFNNILSAILGYVELSMLKTDRNHKVFSYLDQVLKAANRAKDLVRQILSVSRQSEQRSKPVHVQPVIDDVLKLMRASLPSSVEIDDQIDRQTGPIMADTGQVHQILMNLCTNAGQSMNESGGRLTVRLGTVKIGPADISPDFDIAPGAYIRMTVSDTGHGMAEDVQKRIFDPYFTTKVKGMGTGLGLAVVQGIVKKHGGTVTVSSKIGEGTDFTVYLPMIQQIDRSSTEPPPDAPLNLPGGSERILLVDDEAAIIDTGQQMLEHLGYSVTACANSREALSLFQQHPDRFDLVITDMTMPEINGDELSRQIMAVRPDMPVLLCTGYNPRIDEQSARKMGVCAFIFKPINLKNLAVTIRRVIDTPPDQEKAGHQYSDSMQSYT